METDIAAQMLGGTPVGTATDLIMGGGRCNFLPKLNDSNAPTGCRQDGRNLINEARNQGFLYLGNRNDFDQVTEATE